MTGYTLFLLTFLTDMAKAEFKGRPVNHAVLWPGLIGGLFGTCLLLCCLQQFCEKCCGLTCDKEEQDSVPRSEYLAMQKRMEKLEQEVHTMKGKEEV